MSAQSKGKYVKAECCENDKGRNGIQNASRGSADGSGDVCSPKEQVEACGQRKQRKEREERGEKVETKDAESLAAGETARKCVYVAASCGSALRMVLTSAEPPRCSASLGTPSGAPLRGCHGEDFCLLATRGGAGSARCSVRCVRACSSSPA